MKKIINYVDCFGNSPLLQSINRGNFELFFYLIENGANFFYIDNQSNNFIHHVCAQSKENNINDLIKILKLLIEKGVNLNLLNENLISPLHVACANLNLDFIRVLMENSSCDFTLIEKFKRTPFQNFLIKFREKNTSLINNNNSLSNSLSNNNLRNSNNNDNNNNMNNLSNLNRSIDNIQPSISVSTSSSSLSSSTSSPTSSSSSSSISITNIDRFFNNELFSDISFIINGKVIKAHKLILSSRCDYFRALFEGPFAENNTKNERIIEEISFDSFLAVIRYIYTGEVLLVQNDIGVSTLLNNLHAATKYMVDGMIFECEKQLMKIISLENCFAIFSEAFFFTFIFFVVFFCGFYFEKLSRDWRI